MPLPFSYCPKCGASGLVLCGNNLYTCAACGFHYYLNPIAAVAALLPDAEGRLLLIRRAKDPAKGKFAMPGGFIDLGETAEIALARELKEELSLELEFYEYLTSHPNQYFYRGITYQVLDLFFVARVKTWDITTAVAEVAGYFWLNPKEIDPQDLAFDSMRAAWRCYIKRIS